MDYPDWPPVALNRNHPCHDFGTLPQPAQDLKHKCCSLDQAQGIHDPQVEASHQGHHRRLLQEEPLYFPKPPVDGGIQSVAPWTIHLLG